MDNLALATDSGVTLTALEVSYLRRAVRVAYGEAVRQRDHDGTFGRRADVLGRLDRLVSALVDHDSAVRLTLVEGR
jgi:hypothetical protein